MKPTLKVKLVMFLTIFGVTVGIVLFFAIIYVIVESANEGKFIKEIKKDNYIENARMALINNGFNVEKCSYLDKLVGIELMQ